MQKLKGFGYEIYDKPLGKNWLSEMLPGVSILSLKQFTGILDHSFSPFF